MAESKSFKPVIGQSLNWGLVGRQFNVKPQQLTRGSIEIMHVNVREKIDIHGVGMDVVQMSGFFTVRTEDPITSDSGKEKDLNWNNFLVKTKFLALDLVGYSDIFGTVRVRLQETPDFKNEGFVESSNLAFSPAAKCKASLNVAMELPDLKMEIRTDSPVEMGSKVIQIPPIGDVARSEKGSRLIDSESQKVVGEIVSSDIEVGKVIHSQPLSLVGN
jgi:hypothetical protein